MIPALLKTTNNSSFISLPANLNSKRLQNLSTNVYGITPRHSLDLRNSRLLLAYILQAKSHPNNSLLTSGRRPVNYCLDYDKAADWFHWFLIVPRWCINNGEFITVFSHRLLASNSTSNWRRTCRSQSETGLALATVLYELTVLHELTRWLQTAASIC